MPVVSLEDLRKIARWRLPKIFYEYIEGGASSETTLRANTADFGRWQLVQRVLTDITNPRDLSTTFLGTRQPLPFMLGPVGFLGLYSVDGEIKAARAAHAVGIPMCLSNFSINSLSEVRQATGGPLCLQLYMLRDRSFTEEVLQGAEQNGVTTLFLTVDNAITGFRERDARNGMRALDRITPGLAARLITRPLWCIEHLRHGMPKVGAVSHRPEFGDNALAQSGALSRAIDSSLSWRDVAWLRERWKGRLILKGILSAEDALKARDVGAEGIVISNHGGRQLDGASSTIGILPEIAAAVEGRGLELLIDGGFRRGADIVKALALGASGVLLGRAYVYGTAAAGQAGVAKVIEMLTQEIDITLTLMGLSSIDDLKAAGPSVLRPV